MARFRSLYTQIQIRGPVDRPIPVKGRDRFGFLGPYFSAWLGWIGDPQIGRSYLGWWGWAALITGTISICIMGFNFWAQADWNVVAFIRGMAWHRLDPPTGEGLHLRPLNEGGWWQWAGFTLTISVLCWWARIYTRAKALGMGTHVAWAFAAAISRTDGPTALILTRQSVPMLNSIPRETRREGTLKGGYIAKKESGPLERIVLATGSEMHVAMQAVEQLGEGAHPVEVGGRRRPGRTGRPGRRRSDPRGSDSSAGRRGG